MRSRSHPVNNPTSSFSDLPGASISNSGSSVSVHSAAYPRSDRSHDVSRSDITRSESASWTRSHPLSSKQDSNKPGVGSPGKQGKIGANVVSSFGFGGTKISPEVYAQQVSRISL